MARPARLAPRDVLLSAVVYAYFCLAYLVYVLPRLLLALLGGRGERRHWRVQGVLSRFFRGFFRVIGALGGKTTIEVSRDVPQLAGRVLVCNHVSYLDPLLLIATFPRHSTAAKPVWFHVPIFASLLRALGYLEPAGPRTSPASSLPQRVEAMRAHLAGGGVIFLFPEGRRSRDGAVADFQPGAFKLARYLGADVELLSIQGTGVLFPPGRLLFRTGPGARIRLERMGRITAEELAGAASANSLAREVTERYRRHLAQRGGAPA